MAPRADYRIVTAPVIHWFRNDLRLADNPALMAAVAHGVPVIPVFVFDSRILDGRWRSPNRAWFLVESLRELAASLSMRGAPLVIRTGNPVDVIPRLANETGATDVYVSRDYSPYARRRDALVASALESLGTKFHARRGRLIAEPEEVATAAGTPFSVFSPFERKWVMAARRELLPAPDQIEGVPGLASEPLLTFAPTASDLPEAGERAANQRLQLFIADGLRDYADQRDMPAIAGTSRLSADLRFGLISPLQVEQATGMLTEPGVRSKDGARKFVSELAWREFYAHLLWHNPRVLQENFRTDLGAIRWSDDADALRRWQDGATGYPVVDAAMRQLRATGWMHNRARMVAASFLTKHLLIHWQAGEDHFMQHLLDGDPASNNGGWQWAASTGADPQPYFRIFNPVLQGKRFDPDGAYVRGWVPELAGVRAEHIHAPWLMSPMDQAAAGCLIGRDYPGPMVDHAAARERALAAFTAARDAVN